MYTYTVFHPSHNEFYVRLTVIVPFSPTFLHRNHPRPLYGCRREYKTGYFGSASRWQCLAIPWSNKPSKSQCLRAMMIARPLPVVRFKNYYYFFFYSTFHTRTPCVYIRTSFTVFIVGHASCCCMLYVILVILPVDIVFIVLAYNYTVEKYENFNSFSFIFIKQYDHTFLGLSEIDRE